jgi:signal transduction histidine kinase
MKEKQFSIFRRITILVFSLITVLGLLFIAITYFATTHYHQASTQLLNKDVAAHIAEFTSPFEKNGINKQKADSVFKNAMVISPSAQIYFLDTGGKVIAFYAPQKDIKLWKIALENIKKYIAEKGKDYIKAPDPKDPLEPKIFSAAEVTGTEGKLGYIYVILGSNQSENVMDVLLSSHISNLAIKAFVTILLLSIILSLFYLYRIRKSFNRMIDVLEKFEAGDFTARFEIKNDDELAPVTHAFNKMADLLSYNINSLKKAEQERKDFIANVSHDLKTPLAIARGFTETLLIKKEGGDLSEQQRQEYVQLILVKIEQVETMVKQLFELSKIEAAEFKAHKEPFVLSEIVQETFTTFQLMAQEKEVKLICAQCQYHVWINADIHMMERIVQNLVDNAVKSTTKRGKILAYLEVENKELIFRIENTGDPLPEDLLNWINNLNGQDSLSMARPAKLGLGLLIVQKMLYMHGTTLKASAEDSTTNIFSFRIPVYNP